MWSSSLCGTRESRFEPIGWLVFKARSVQLASFKNQGCSSAVDDFIRRLDVIPVFILFTCVQKVSETEGETTGAQGHRVMASFDASTSIRLFMSHWHLVVLMWKTFSINENVSFWLENSNLCH